MQNKAGQPGREPGAYRTQHGQWEQQEPRKRGRVVLEGTGRTDPKMKLVLLSRIITGRALGATTGFKFQLKS